ncbi:hypothetical protein EV702DRAFT_940830, partial [Suillus placidus]
QNVPHAIELILAIIKLAKSYHTIINNSFSMDIDTCADLKSITLLSTLIESFLTPFIDTTFSLFEQIQYLSHYTHLTFAFFHAHWCSFMSYQLYYDTQTTVNNDMFYCTKQQILDPNALFYFWNVGDDPLEILFERTCMIRGHNSACSYAQAIDHLEASKDIDDIF